jgi:hypothetical protein
MPTGDQGNIVYVLFFFAGAGLTTFVVSAALPWWISKYILYTAGGSCVLLSIANAVSPNRTPGDFKSLIIKCLAAVTGIVGIGQLMRWGTVEFVKTFSAGIKARQEAGI